MRNAPEYRNWAAQTRALASEPEMACIREPLLALASNALQNPAPLDEFVAGGGREVAYEDLWRASQKIETVIPGRPCTALLASTIALMLWATRLDEELYGQMNGMPPAGWVQFPLVCAEAAFAAGAADEALRLLERSLDVLNAAKYKDQPAYQAAVARYRDLGVRVETRRRSGFEDLANDLRDSCRTDQPNFRAEVGALLWTLGMIPESGLFLPGAPDRGLPPLRLCRWIVNVSHAGIPLDPLTQYIWLEMKDREPFHIRDHPLFFGVANLRYKNFPPDEYMPKPPSRLFAKTVIAWFRGDLEEKTASAYVDSFRLIEAMFPGGQIDWSVYLRSKMLALMVGKRFGWIGEKTLARPLEVAQKMMDQAASVNANAFRHPEWPEIYTRTAGPMFAVLEQLAEDSAPAEERIARLERFRAASIDYWLAAAPPLPSAGEQAAAAGLIQEEDRLLTNLKGAYFMLLAPILPMHYRRATRTIDVNDPSTFNYPDMGSGPEHYKRLQRELEELHARMQTVAPEYARRRTDPVADLSGLASALGMHRKRT